MPELQRLYTDEALRAVEAKTYHQMTVDQMVHMMTVLFPYMDANDHFVFLNDIKQATPDKFIPAFSRLLKAKVDASPIISSEAAHALRVALGVESHDLVDVLPHQKLAYKWEKQDADSVVVETQYDREKTHAVPDSGKEDRVLDR